MTRLGTAWYYLHDALDDVRSANKRSTSQTVHVSLDKTAQSTQVQDNCIPTLPHAHPLDSTRLAR
jgi:hypothetical protein